MKAIIWIIILLLIGWGVWSWMKDDVDVDNQPAATVQGLDDLAGTSDEATGDASEDVGPYEDKG